MLYPLHPLTRTLIVAALVSGILYCRYIDLSFAFLAFTLLVLSGVWISRGRLIFPRLFAISTFLAVLPLYLGILWLENDCVAPRFLWMHSLALGSCEQATALLKSCNRASMLVLGYAWVNSLTLTDGVGIVTAFSKVFGRHATIASEIGLMAITAYLRFVGSLRTSYESLMVRIDWQATFSKRTSQWITMRRLQLTATLRQLDRTIQSLTFATAQTSSISRDPIISISASVNAGSPFNAGNWSETFDLPPGGSRYFDEDRIAPRPVRALTIVGYLPRMEGRASHFHAEYTTHKEKFSSKDTRLEHVASRVFYATADFPLVLSKPTVRDQLIGSNCERLDTKSLATQFGIDQLLDSDCLQLSGGETVLVVLASALLSGKRLVVADISLDALSEERRAAVNDALSKATASGVSLLLERQHGGSQAVADAPVEDSRSAREAADELTVEAASPVLQVDDLEVRRDDRTLLRGVSFLLRPGEIVGLRGENGTGKTTLLKTLAGLLEPGKGSIHSSGRVRMSFQHSDEQLVQRTVAEELGVAVELNGHPGTPLRNIPHELPVPEASARVDELAPAQRRWLCIASMMPASVVLVDEPNVDWKDQSIDNIRLLRRFCRSSGLAALVVSHSTGILSACDRILDTNAWLPRGELN